MYRMKTEDEMKDINVGTQFIFPTVSTIGKALLGYQTDLFTALSKRRSSFVHATW